MRLEMEGRPVPVGTAHSWFLGISVGFKDIKTSCQVEATELNIWKSDSQHQLSELSYWIKSLVPLNTYLKLLKLKVVPLFNDEKIAEYESFYYIPVLFQSLILINKCRAMISFFACCRLMRRLFWFTQRPDRRCVSKRRSK